MPDAACSIVRPMHETTPQVFLIARPSIDLEGMRGYLQDVGGESWLELRTAGGEEQLNGGELLVEFGGRACYRSWEPGLNPNVTRIRTDRAAVLREHPAQRPRQRARARELLVRDSERSSSFHP